MTTADNPRRDDPSGGEQAPIIEGAGDDAVRVHELDIPDNFTVDVKAIRQELGLSQTEFARAFGFSVHTLRKWEQWVRRPEKPTRLFLLVIREMPERVNELLHQWEEEQS
ncbi:MAG: helix-turn-helix domain-containing protein [Persicimonas sp.]